MAGTHHVVIIGGGFGGLYCARALRDAPVQVTILDRRNFHLFQPLLYQVATGTLAPGDIAVPLRSLLRGQQNSRVLLAEAVDVNVPQRQILLRDGDVIPYDTLILAAGSEPNYFGHDEWRLFAPGLKTVEDATAMRSRILFAFEAAERETDPERVVTWLTFVVVGAGPTGVELAGALAEVARRTLRDNYRHIDPADAKILLIDAGSHVLKGYPEDLAKKAERDLHRLGVTVRHQSRVTDVRPDAVIIGQGEQAERIPTRTVLWTTGVLASSLAKALSRSAHCELDQHGRVIVNSDLSVPEHPEIFVIGDLANPSAEKEQDLPGVAPVAMQEGNYVAHLIKRRFKGQTLGPFHYNDPGNLATIGRNSAVADLGRFKFSGFLAWVIWAFVHVFNLLEFENRLLVMLQWAWSYMTWNRTDLLITYPRRTERAASADQPKEPVKPL